MRTVTVKRYPSMPWRFQVTEDGPQLQYLKQRDAGDAGEAAAVAIEFARHSAGSYVIVGPDEVMQHIPAEIRFG